MTELAVKWRLLGCTSMEQLDAELAEAGYAIVPVEPTEEMVMSGERAYVLTGELSSVYPAMLRAGGHVDG